MKLQKYGIRGIALSWLSSCLRNRYQYVQIQNFKSQPLKVTCGVPQGSIMGPLLFNLYIDICEVSENIKTILFADDSNLLCCADNLGKLLFTVEKELGKMKSWFNANKLTKDLLNQASLYTLYCSFILSYIIYCVEEWGNTYKTNTEPIFNHQKRAIRIVNKTTYREHTNPLFIKIKVSFKTIQIMCKIINYQTVSKGCFN